MTKVINLFGGPGCGKSTLAAELYHHMKKAGESVELVREYVKDWAWAGREVNQYDQLLISGKQSQRESVLYGKVDYIITDAPLLLGPFYEIHYTDRDIMLPSVRKFLNVANQDGISHYNFLLARLKQYNPDGRYETEEQALAIDQKLEAYLNHYAGSPVFQLKNNDIETILGVVKDDG